MPTGIIGEGMRKRNGKIDIVQLLRLLAQVAFFLLLPALFINAYGGVRLLVSSLAHHTAITAAQAPQLVAAAAVFPATLLFGRFFCGWMCAFGALGDFIYRIFGRFVKRKIDERADRALKYLKYAVLVFLVVIGWILGAKLPASANPWDAFGLLATAGQPVDMGFILANFLPALVLLALIAVGSVFVERFFCRYLCPLGAVFAILSRLRIVKIDKPNARCGKCRICTTSCAMGIPLYGKNVIASGECIGCMKCVPACPRGNVSVAIAGSDLRPAAAGMLAAAAIAGVYVIGSNSMESLTGTQPPAVRAETSAPQAALQAEPQTEPPTVTPAPQPAGIYKDGTFEGSGQGFRGTTTVQVTVSGDVITGITIVSHRDDRQFFQTASPVIVEEILQAQSPDVDTVSGATYSSNGIISAVADALEKARI
jgi:polyferredoxin